MLVVLADEHHVAAEAVDHRACKTVGKAEADGLGLAGAVIDRFGRDVMLIREDDEHFSVSIEAVVSPQFYAWVFGFGDEAEILSGEGVRRGMADMAARVLEKYAEK